ncbi:MAG: PfkB family carbohydrate kinase [Armatimonadota bacterium]
MGSVLIVGSIALDSVSTPFGRVEEALGGAAVFAGCAASLLAEVRLVGVVGDDFPQEHLDLLAQRGVDLRGVQRVAGGKTFRWRGSYEYDMARANTLATELNVFADFRPEIPAEYRDSDIVFLANIDPELQLSVLEQVERPRLSMCDTMNFWIEGKRDELLEVLSRVDLGLMNDAEVRELTGQPALANAGRAALELGPRYVVIKKGEHGAMLLSEGRYFAAPSYPLATVRDPTGAGDSFAGGLAGFLAHTGDVGEANLRRALVVGTIMASYCCEDFSLEGLRRATREDVRRRYGELRDITAFGELE